MSLEQNYTAILGQLGEDVSREGLLDTPKRAAKAMQYLCRGYSQTLEEVTNGALFSSDNSEMVLVKDIELCSHSEYSSMSLTITISSLSEANSAPLTISSRVFS